MFPRSKDKYEDREEHPLSLREALRDEDISEKIEDLSNEKYEGQFDREQVASFFGCDPSELSDEEVSDFYLYAKYASRRLILAELAGTKEEILDELESHRISMRETLAGHDIAHTLVEHSIRSGETFVPGFVSAENKINNKDLIEDELFAVLWSSVLSSKPLIMALCFPYSTEELIKSLEEKHDEEGAWMIDDIKRALEHIDHTSSASIINSYLGVVLTLVKGINLREAKEHGFRGPELDRVSFDYDEIARDIMANPPKELITITTKVLREYSHNNKILYDEFMVRCRPLLERLRRKESKME